MNDEPKGEDEARWLRPPAPGELRVEVSVGEGARLSPEVRQALDDLGRALAADEVEGYVNPKGKCNICGMFRYCSDYLDCKPQTVLPCSPGGFVSCGREVGR